MSNGRCPWDVFIRFPYLDGRVNYIHIGVGSDVVCSIPIGNTRASIRGADNSDGSTLFYVLMPVFW